MHQTRIRIRWHDMDAYGHVNNAIYLNYLEECRDAWVQDVLGSVAESTWHFVLARVAIDFRSELTQDDGEILVRCRLESIGSSIRTHEEIVKTNGVLAAAAGAVIVPRDPERGTSRPLTDAERAALERELGSAE